MQAIHESGHVLAAWLTGAHIERVVLHPLVISRTDIAENPRPLIVVWAGPLCGVVFPFLIWIVSVAAHYSAAFLLRFFAGFCCIANGLYISVGSFDRMGDCREMLMHGSQPWQLWLFGTLTVPCGFWLWHKQGTHFGLSAAAEAVRRRDAYAALVALLILLAGGLWVDGR